MRVNSTELQNSFGKYLNLLEQEDIIVMKNGKSVAKLIAYQDPEYFFIHESKEDYNLRRRISYNEYLEYVNSSDQRLELIDGEIYLLSSPSFLHQVIVRRLTVSLDNLLNKPCQVVPSPFDVRLHGYALKFEEDPNVVQPDLVVICDPENVEEDGKYEGVPTLLVEVLSPSSRNRDFITKLHLYQRSGVREYWIVDPESKCIWQYFFTADRELIQPVVYYEKEQLQSQMFSNLVLELGDIFADNRYKQG